MYINIKYYLILGIVTQLENMQYDSSDTLSLILEPILDIIRI